MFIPDPNLDALGPSHPSRCKMREAFKKGLEDGLPLREFVESYRKVSTECGQVGVGQKWLLEDLALIGVPPEVIDQAINQILRFLHERPVASASAPDLHMQFCQALPGWFAEMREKLQEMNRKSQAYWDYERWEDMQMVRRRIQMSGGGIPDPILRVYPGHLA